MLLRLQLQLRLRRQRRRRLPCASRLSPCRGS